MLLAALDQVMVATALPTIAVSLADVDNMSWVVTANLLCATAVTPLYGKLGLDSAALEATAAQIQAQIPLGRFGTPDEIASTVLHLSAPESAFIVGTEIIVDGGMSQL